MEVDLRSEASLLQREVLGGAGGGGSCARCFPVPSPLESRILHGCCETSVGFAQLFLQLGLISLSTSLGSGIRSLDFILSSCSFVVLLISVLSVHKLRLRKVG